MAKREHWEVDPFNWPEVMKRITGKDVEDMVESKGHARRILEDIPGGLRCLEIGAGYGRLLPRMLHHFPYAFGVDSSCAMVALATLYLRHEITCKVLLGSGEHVPYPDETFDFVYSFTCFQHMEDLETIRVNFSEAHRVLVPERKFRLQTVLGERSHGDLYDGYVFESPAELSNELMRAGFRMTAHSIDEEKSWIWMTATK